MGQGRHCHHPPQDTPSTISRLELFQSLVNSGTPEGPQDGLNILLVLPRALATDPPQ